MMKISMRKLYDMYISLLEKKADGATSVSGVLSKLGINMEDYWHCRQFGYLIDETKCNQKQIKIKLPYRTSNECGYIPLEIIKKYYVEASRYLKTFRLAKDEYHNIEIETTIQTKEYVVDLNMLLDEIKRELTGKITIAKYNHRHTCERIDELNKRKNSLAKEIKYVKNFKI